MNLEEHQDKINKEHEAKVYEVDYAAERYNVCKVCPHFITKIMVCKQCMCFMPVKVMLPFVSCPINAWAPYEG